MKTLPAVVVAAHTLVNQYHVIVRIEPQTIKAHTPHLFLETTSRSSVPVTTVGLISFTCGIPDFKQAKNFRCGRLREFNRASADRFQPASPLITPIRGSYIAKTKLSVRKAKEGPRKEGQEGRKEAAQAPAPF
jgi:hypothetical protein